LYTVTSSGIVSAQRFEQHLRLNPPQLDLAVGQLSATSATLQAFLFRSPGAVAANANSAISPHCQLHVLVSDSSTSELLLDRTLSLADQKSLSLAVEGLRPWRKYAANAQVKKSEKNNEILMFFE
jgi:hypothetical protein